VTTSTSEWVTVAEAATALGITVCRVHQLLRRGTADARYPGALPDLAAQRHGAIWLVTRASVERRVAAATCHTEAQ